MARIIGEQKLIRNLKALERQPSGPQLDRIALAALEPMRKETSDRAPLAALKSGVVARKHRARGSGQEYWIAFRRGMAMRIAHLVELGTAPHSMARGASRRKGLLQHLPPWHPGTQPRPFMTPAFESTKHEVIETYGRGFWAAISAVAAKLGGGRL